MQDILNFTLPVWAHDVNLQAAFLGMVSGMSLAIQSVTWNLIGKMTNQPLND